MSISRIQSSAGRICLARASFLHAVSLRSVGLANSRFDWRISASLRASPDTTAQVAYSTHTALTDADLLSNLRYWTPALDDLGHRITLELIAETGLPHRRLLSSKLRSGDGPHRRYQAGVGAVSRGISRRKPALVAGQSAPFPEPGTVSSFCSGCEVDHGPAQTLGSQPTAQLAQAGEARPMYGSGGIDR